ncbi:hypothetical protein BDW02DRAFT_569007 [Decorospora gaudefroyi]|uniref:Uncharacterized protein n=1 Tax=Decorospora gaudefroyi TaxID=184978 RepID=A0A6A5KDU5_9PLEO|nr:hypothetical protein BDW02DRAFT_569007 [Decorospora gaudefroyi]
MSLLSFTAAKSPPAPVLPYTDDGTTFTNHTLCPRYADHDTASAPPSPASIESLEILDNIPWRRGYIALDAGRGRSRRRWMKNKGRLVAIVLLLTLATAGCALAGYLTIQHERSK